MLTLNDVELEAIKSWTWHSSSQRAMTTNDVETLRRVGVKQKQARAFHLPKQLYRAVRVNGNLPSADNVLSYAMGDKSWSKTKSGAEWYIKTNGLSGKPVNQILFVWQQPNFDDVFVDFNSLTKATNLDLGADAGEFMAQPLLASVASVEREVISGRRGTALRLVVVLR